jgi:inorganic pyrophosphatase
MLSAYDSSTKLVTVIIDTPFGDRCKYKYDENNAVCRLSKVLPLGHSFPYNFGFVPGTRADDGDALDVLVLLSEPLVVGCVLAVHLLGVLEAEQREADGRVLRNDRLLGSVSTKVNAPWPTKLADMTTQSLEEIQHFFVSYNEMEGRVFRPLGYQSADRAWQLLLRSLG